MSACSLPGPRHAHTIAHTSMPSWAGVKTEPGTIVVVEDDPNIADLVDMYLRREGFRVIQAADGASRAGRHRPGEAPPGHPRRRPARASIDGLEVCRRVRADGRHCRC